MVEHAGSGVVNIRLFGFLRSFMKERGLPDRFDETVPPEGKSGLEVAAELGLPKEKIEAVFRNGLIQQLDAKIYPGDRVAFVPSGTPGPYRVLLGMVKGR
jgi:molybdopterin converting factor small subunit